MNWFKKIFKSLRQTRKFSLSDPESFEEVWSVNTSGIRLISLLILILILFGVANAFLFRGSGSFFEKDVSIERQTLEDQQEMINDLSGKITQQEQLLIVMQQVLKGETDAKLPMDSLKVISTSIDLDSIKTSETSAEKKLADKLRYKLSTQEKDPDQLIIFTSPVKGIVSQTFDADTHPAIDVVVEPETVVKSCLTGNVVYSGYTRKDGYVTIINHGNDFISVYKHNKRTLKDSGSRVKIGDPIAIAGNTGENSTGPHVHFELWYQGKPVDPKKYISFTK